MSEIKRILLFLLVFLPALAAAGDDDYILGLNAFGDGIYSIAAPALEAYLKDGQDSNKRSYAKYLLYKTYLKQNRPDEAQRNLRDILDIDDSRFDKAQMASDNMMILTALNCTKAAEFAASRPDDAVIDLYTNSKCPIDNNFIKNGLTKTKNETVRMRAVARASDKPEIVNRIFDSMGLSAMSSPSKKYFAVYFYKHKDFTRFDKVKSEYMDADLAGLDLDRYWVKGDKQGYMDRFTSLNAKFPMTGAPVCRAIELFNESGRDFDCNLVNRCITEYTLDFVRVKGACIAGKKDPKAMTAFADSLGMKIFPGLCGYGEFIFANSLYIGEREAKFAICENRFNIADVILQKKNFKSLANMFKDPKEDMDRYYAAIGYAGLGKKKEAAEAAAKIDDAYLKSKLAGTVK